MFYLLLKESFYKLALLSALSLLHPPLEKLKSLSPTSKSGNLVRSQIQKESFYKQLVPE